MSTQKRHHGRQVTWIIVNVQQATCVANGQSRVPEIFIDALFEAILHEIEPYYTFAYAGFNFAIPILNLQLREPMLKDQVLNSNGTDG
jgi:hypothetical protein